MPVDMDNLGLLSSLPFQNVLLPCSPLMYSALMMASLYGCRCFMCSTYDQSAKSISVQNQSFSQYTSQSIGMLEVSQVSQAIGKLLLNQSVNQSINQCTSQSGNQAVSQSLVLIDSLMFYFAT